jgi:hypothetical protein
MQGPVAPGITYQAHGIPNEVVEARTLRVSSATTLRDLEDEYFCYTPALFYLFVRLNGLEPFADFVAEYGRQVWPFTIQLSKPVFRGLEVGTSSYWNHTLYFMERAHGLPYVEWMTQNAFYDREHNVLSRIRYKNIWIADALQLEHSAVVPAKPQLAQIMVFCLETNRGNYYIREAVEPAKTLPVLKTQSTVFKDTAAFADAIWKGFPDPYTAAMQAVSDEASPGLSDLQARVEAAGPLRMPDPTNLEDLPAEHRQEIMNAMRQLRSL